MTDISRRSFMASSAAAVAGPMILPSGVLAANGKPGANDKLVIGHIGVGGMGTGHLKFTTSREDVSVAAVCDVDKTHLASAMDLTGGKAEGYNDFRQVLDRKDIDAVIIATPDHWHGIMAVAACEAGKDVYCEKPSSKTIEEGIAMMAAVKTHGTVMQIGSQGRSTEGGRFACNYVRNGQLGKVNRVECWHTENPVGGDWSKNQPAPPELDWDMWLGPAKWVPYNPDRVHFNFRWFMDFGAGNIRDRGAHILNVASWCLDLDKKNPVRITAEGAPPDTGMYDCPPKMTITFEFKDPELTIVWAQPGTKPEGIDHDYGAVYHGDKDSLIVRGGDGGCHTEEKAMKYVPPADGYHAFESPGHHQNWFDCIKSRELPLMNIEAAHRIATLCILGEIALRIQRPIEWDGDKQNIIGDEHARLLLASPGRGQWHM